MNVTTCTEKG